MQNKIPVQLSSNYCQYRNADKNVNVWNSKAAIVSHPQFRIRSEREPSRISYKMVTRLSSEKNKNKNKTKKSVKLYIRIYVPKSSKLKVMLRGHHRDIEVQSSFFFSKKCFIRQSLRLCIF